MKKVAPNRSCPIGRYLLHKIGLLLKQNFHAGFAIRERIAVSSCVASPWIGESFPRKTGNVIPIVFGLTLWLFDHERFLGPRSLEASF